MPKAERIFVYGNAQTGMREHRRLGTVAHQGGAITTCGTTVLVDLGPGPLLAGTHEQARPTHGQIFLTGRANLERIDSEMAVGKLTHRRRVTVKVTSGPYRGRRWRAWTWVARDDTLTAGRPLVPEGSWRRHARRTMRLST